MLLHPSSAVPLGALLPLVLRQRALNLGSPLLWNLIAHLESRLRLALLRLRFLHGRLRLLRRLLRLTFPRLRLLRHRLRLLRRRLLGLWRNRCHLFSTGFGGFRLRFYARRCFFASGGGLRHAHRLLNRRSVALFGRLGRHPNPLGVGCKHPSGVISCTPEAKKATHVGSDQNRVSAPSAIAVCKELSLMRIHPFSLWNGVFGSRRRVAYVFISEN